MRPTKPDNSKSWSIIHQTSVYTNGAKLSYLAIKAINVPELMTFEGRNYDTFSGITAPLVAYVGLQTGKTNRPLLLVWNLICLALLLTIIAIAFLSAPTPLQKFAFEQPNRAIGNFPFSWLPTFVVPIVLFGHLVSIRQLLKRSATA